MNTAYSKQISNRGFVSKTSIAHHFRGRYLRLI